MSCFPASFCSAFFFPFRVSTGASYEVLTNKFPLFAGHMLLVSRELVPQQMRAVHLKAISELLAGCTGFSAYFNSWCASASVNHFHCHLIDEVPPVAALPLVRGPLVRGVRCLQPEGFPGFCYVFAKAMTPCGHPVVSSRICSGKRVSSHSTAGRFATQSANAK